MSYSEPNERSASDSSEPELAHEESCEDDAAGGSGDDMDGYKGQGALVRAKVMDRGKGFNLNTWLS